MKGLRRLPQSGERSVRDPNAYLFTGILIVLTLLLSVAMVGAPTFISRFLRVNRPTKEKLSVYECGVNPIGEARVRFSIKFYLIAMLFILFDIDLVFLYPWAAVHRWLGWFGLAEMAVFIGILMVGFVYIWKRRGFEWE